MPHLTMSNSAGLHNLCLCHLASPSTLMKSGARAAPSFWAGRSPWHVADAAVQTPAGLWPPGFPDQEKLFPR